MQWAALILGVAALGGVVLATIRLTGTSRPPTWMAVGHGIVAATGVGTLIYMAATTGMPLLAQIALGCFVIAAFGGATLFLAFHLKERPLLFPLCSIPDCWPSPVLCVVGCCFSGDERIR